MNETCLLLKLIDGECAIGMAVVNNDSHIVLENVVSLHTFSMNDGSMIEILGPYSRYADNLYVTFKQSHIISVQDVLPGMTKYYESYVRYMQATGEDIRIAEDECATSTASWNAHLEAYIEALSKKALIQDIPETPDEKSEFWNMECPSNAIN